MNGAGLWGRVRWLNERCRVCVPCGCSTSYAYYLRIFALQWKIQIAQDETAYHNCKSVEELRKTMKVGRNLFWNKYTISNNHTFAISFHISFFVRIAAGHRLGTKNCVFVSLEASSHIKTLPSSWWNVAILVHEVLFKWNEDRTSWHNLKDICQTVAEENTYLLSWQLGMKRTKVWVQNPRNSIFILNW
jgi:hypothetical protein